MAVTMYGIKNCDTIAKARKWLEQRGISYVFHDYKTSGIDRERLSAWAVVVKDRSRQIAYFCAASQMVCE